MAKIIYTGLSKVGVVTKHSDAHDVSTSKSLDWKFPLPYKVYMRHPLPSMDTCNSIIDGTSIAQALSYKLGSLMHTLESNMSNQYCAGLHCHALGLPPFQRSTSGYEHMVEYVRCLKSYLSGHDAM